MGDEFTCFHSTVIEELIDIPLNILGPLLVPSSMLPDKSLVEPAARISRLNGPHRLGAE